MAHTEPVQTDDVQWLDVQWLDVQWLEVQALLDSEPPSPPVLALYVGACHTLFVHVPPHCWVVNWSQPVLCGKLAYTPSSEWL